jgi:transcriptional regulator with XRE-family HTH domain
MNTDLRDRFNRAVRHIIAEQLAGSAIVIAAAIDSHQPHLSAVMNNKRMPTINMLVNLCKAYNISPEYLLLGSGEIFRIPEKVTISTTKKKSIPT